MKKRVVVLAITGASGAVYAVRLLEVLEAEMEPDEKALFEEGKNRAEAALGGVDFTAAWNEGQMMALEAIIELALCGEPADSQEHDAIS